MTRRSRTGNSACSTGDVVRVLVGFVGLMVLAALAESIMDLFDG
jgi:hypothetical protein